MPSRPPFIGSGSHCFDFVFVLVRMYYTIRTHFVNDSKSKEELVAVKQYVVGVVS